jgi:hypothetical protein
MERHGPISTLLVWEKGLPPAALFSGEPKKKTKKIFKNFIAFNF